MAIRHPIYTIEQFNTFIELPENADRLFEFIRGEIIEVPSNPFVSKIAMMIGAILLAFVEEHQLGHITGETGGYIVSGERYAPDVAYISYEKQPELASQGYNPNPPDLAVEVISSESTEELNRLRIKISNYLAAGTVVWVVNPDDRLVEVHIPGQAVTIFREGDTLTGGAVLEGFEVTVDRFFRK